MIKILISLFIVALFIYMRLNPYKDKLNTQSLKIYNILDACFRPIFSIIAKVIKPRQVGIGLQIDLSSIVVLILLLIILNFIK